MNKIDYIKWITKKQIQAWLGKELNYSLEVQCKKERLGSNYGGWWVCTEYLDKNSIVYDVGLGTDISFSLELISRFGMDIYGFDPTPRSLEWIKKQSLPDEFHFFPYALSDHDGELILYSPPQEEYASFSIAGVKNNNNEFRAPAMKLSTLMKKNGHTKIDILKMDIEGAKYDVIENILAENLEVRQILVEVHHNIYPQFSIEKSRHLVESLRSSGYKIFKVSPSRCEYHFIKP